MNQEIVYRMPYKSVYSKKNISLSIFKEGWERENNTGSLKGIREELKKEEGRTFEDEDDAAHIKMKQGEIDLDIENLEMEINWILMLGDRCFAKRREQQSRIGFRWTEISNFRGNNTRWNNIGPATKIELTKIKELLEELI
jgi:hypothetical protein